jgi:hypothetical protein
VISSILPLQVFRFMVRPCSPAWRIEGAEEGVFPAQMRATDCDRNQYDFHIQMMSSPLPGFFH